MRHPHHFSDQFEKILLALLLLWLGAFAVSGALEALRWSEVLVAVAVILVIRPVAGFLALLPVSGTMLGRATIALFGIRGFGTVFYVAFAQGHAQFPSMDGVWRIAVLCILLSIVVHGTLGPLMTRRLSAHAGRTR